MCAPLEPRPRSGGEALRCPHPLSAPPQVSYFAVGADEPLREWNRSVQLGQDSATVSTPSGGPPGTPGLGTSQILRRVSDWGGEVLYV